MVFVGGKTDNRCFGEAYILLLKDDEKKTEIQNALETTFKDSFLSILE